MSQASVFAELANEKARLLEKIVSNEELSQVIMGLLARLIFVCECEKGKPVPGMTFDPWECHDAQFKSRVHYNGIVTSMPLMWGPQSDFASYAKQKAGRMALALSDNPAMEKWFQSLVEAIDQYATHKGIPFAALAFKKHIITPDDMVVLEVGRRFDAQ